MQNSFFSGTHERNFFFSLAIVFSLFSVCFLSFGICVETPELSLQLDERLGSVVSIRDIKNNHDHIASRNASALWLICFNDASGSPVSPADAQEFSWHYTSQSPEALQLTWKNFRQEHLRGISVHVTVAATDALTTLWNMNIKGLENTVPTAIHFPRISPIAKQPDEVLAVPYWIGEKTTQHREMLANTGRLEWTYPGILSMQCITLYSEQGPGIYLAADDIQARSKSFAAFYDTPDNTGIEICHYPNINDIQEGLYTVPYNSLVSLFKGDWITVAEQYRKWALEQPWARQSRLKTGQTPGWAADTGFWIWNRDHSIGVLPPAIEMQEYLQLPVSVFWHWWHGCAYDAGFPEYLPPREGNDAFRTALANAQAQGIHAIVYMNQRLWGMETKSWAAENAAEYAVKKQDGTIQPEIYNTFTKSPCASMCMGTSFWRNKYAGLAAEAFSSLGVNGIYMDQACSSLVCYASGHEHTPGGGTYWMEGFQTLASDIRQRCNGIVLAGEGVGESWLPYLDLMLSLQVSMERYAAPGRWEPIPFFNAVYHGYTIQYGNYASLTRPPYDSLWPQELAPPKPLELLNEKFRYQLRLEQGRSFVWGQQPCLANFREEQMEKRPQELAFIKNLALLRSKTLPYLLHGTFRRPPKIHIPQMEIDMSRLSIYAGQQDAVKEYRKCIPGLLISAWEDDMGSIALPVVNISDEPMEITLGMDSHTEKLPETGTVYKIQPDQELKLFEYTHGTVTLKDTLQGASACVYKITRYAP